MREQSKCPISQHQQIPEESLDLHQNLYFVPWPVAECSTKNTEISSQGFGDMLLKAGFPSKQLYYSQICQKCVALEYNISCDRSCCLEARP